MDDEFWSFLKTHIGSILLSVLVVILIAGILAGVAFSIDRVWFATQIVKLLGVAVAKAGPTDPGESVPISDTYLEPFEVIYWNGNPVTFYLDDEVHEASFEAAKEGGCDPLYLDVVAFSESPTYQNTECSPAGACGTWQFMLETWKWMLRELGLDPNISRFNRKVAAKAACLYLKTTGSAQSVNISKAAHRAAFAQVPPVWNRHTGQADFVYDTYHAAKVLAEGGEVIPTDQMRFEFKAEWAKWIAKFLQFAGLWPEELFATEPWDEEGLPEISPPFPGTGSICRPVPEEAYITYVFGQRYEWGVHYGTDFAMPGLVPFPVFALTSGTVSTGRHLTVNGIVVLRPDGIDNTVIKYFHMRESTIAGLSGHVECGSPLGIADGGGTMSDGPHLHLQIEVNGVRVDPMKWIEEQR